MLDREEQQTLLKLLQKYEHIFDGTMRTWNTEPVDLILKEPTAAPYYAKAYLVPNSQKQKAQRGSGQIM